MKSLRFDGFVDLVEAADNKLDEIIKYDEYNSVSIIAKYESAKQILKQLAFIDYTFKSIELHDEMFDNYYDEYIISIDAIDNNHEIWCEPMKRSEGYIDDESTISYILDECSSEVLKHCNAQFKYDTYVDEVCDDLDDNNKSDVSGTDADIKYDKDVDGNTHGFSVSKSDENSSIFYSYYTTEDLNHDDIRDLLKIFDI